MLCRFRPIKLLAITFAHIFGRRERAGSGGAQYPAGSTLNS
jgi:hypothetical protein